VIWVFVVTMFLRRLVLEFASGLDVRSALSNRRVY